MTHSCFFCGWNKIDSPTSSDTPDYDNPPTLIGICWAYIEERGGPMEIKATRRGDGKYIADTGCKKWTSVKQNFLELKKNKPMREEEL